MRRSLRFTLLIGVALLGGAGVAIQARLIGDVAALHGALPTTASMFLIGATALTFAVLFSRRDRAAVARIPLLLRNRELRIIDTANGVAGATTVVVQGLTVGPLGVALFTMGFVCGQVTGGAVLDAFGAAGRRIPINPLRLAGGVLTILAVGLTASAGGAADGAILFVVLTALSGVLGAWIGTASARVNVSIGRVVSASWVNFAGGFVVLVLVCVAIGQVPLAYSALTDWRLLPGAVLGIAAIGATTLLVRRLGVLALAICWIGGQLGTAMALDSLRDANVSWTLGVGVSILIVALVMTTVDGARRDQAPGRVTE